MSSSRSVLPKRRRGLERSLWAATAALGLIPAVGCQVEYAGMTLPSGKYMRDDVQYFAPGPDFPWANTQAATQRARMAAMGQTPPPAPSGDFSNPSTTVVRPPDPAIPAQPFPDPVNAAAGGAPRNVPTPPAPAVPPPPAGGFDAPQPQ
ncbi:MAG: hypothetical protein SFX72_09715 [Isosphaeraceae bacterium]|nr:hypothetical protein [Isosphaeraceae bacterium]